MKRPYPFVSIIVPVYNDEKRIEKCIKSLLNQNYPTDSYEVIVVDNGSTDRTVEKIRKYPVTLIEEKTVKSSYAARNKGVGEGRGDIFAFTDSDCIADSKWLAEGIKPFFQTDNCGIIGGRIIFFFQKKDSPSILETLDTHQFLNQEHYIKNTLFSATANMFTLRKVFETTGLFNPTLKSGGDAEWGNRVAKNNYGLIFAEKAVIYHPARHLFRQHLEKSKRISDGQYTLSYRRFSKKQQFIKLMQTEFLPPVQRVINTFLYDKKDTFIQTTAFALLIVIFKYFNFYWKLRAILFSEKE